MVTWSVMVAMEGMKNDPQGEKQTRGIDVDTDVSNHKQVIYY